MKPAGILVALWVSSVLGFSQTPAPAAQTMLTLPGTLSPHSSYAITGPENFVVAVPTKLVCGKIEGIELIPTKNPSFQAIWSEDESLCLWLRFAGDHPKTLNSIVLIHMIGAQLSSQVDILKSIRDQIVTRSNFYPEGLEVSIKLDHLPPRLTFPIKYTSSLEKGNYHLTLVGLIDRQGRLSETSH